MFTSLDQFQVQNKILGKGTYGNVKLAKHIQNQKQYALKIVDKTNLKQAELLAIQREIQIHQSVQHKNIIQFEASFEQDNKIIMVLEYAPKGTLAQLLQNKKKLSEQKAKTIIKQLIDAIDYLHKNDILHRDIKSENILFDNCYQLKLCDFGWAANQIKSKRNTFCGTYEYMSPEVVNYQNYQEDVDIWSIGVLLYELVQGFTPFVARSSKQIMNNIKNQTIKFNSIFTSQLQNLIQNILQKNKTDRFNIEQIRNDQWMISQEKFRDVSNIIIKSSRGSFQKRVESREKQQDIENFISNRYLTPIIKGNLLKK